MRRIIRLLFDNKKSLFQIFLFSSIILLTVFLPFYTNAYAFNIGQDFRDQFALFYYDFVETIKNSIKTQTMPFYSFDIFLGNSFWSSRLFYYNNIYDFLTFPLSILFSQLRYEEISIIQLSLKALVSAFSMFTYVRYRKYNEQTAILASLAFAFSSFYFGFASFHFFLSFYSFVPLYFLSLEYFLSKDKNYVLYSLMVAFLLITNYYQFYTLSILTIIYYLWRYYEINGNFKNVFFPTLKIIGLYLIGVLLTSPITIPNFVQLLGNNRLNEVSTSLFYTEYKTYIQIFFGLFIPSSALNGTLGTLFTSEWNSMFSFSWSGSFIALILPQIFIDKTKKAQQIVVFVLFIILFLPIGSSIMHAFTAPTFRWTQFLPMFSILLTLDYLDNPHKIDWNLLNLSAFLFSFILLILPFLILWFEGLSLVTNLRQIITLFIYSFFIMSSAYLLKYKKIKQLKWLFVLEIIFIGNMSLFYNQTHSVLDSQTINGATHTLGNKNQLNYFLDENSRGEFYRVFVDYNSIYWGYSYNMNLKYNFKGLMSYDSLMTTSSHDIDKLVNQNLFVTWGKNITNANLVNFLNTKYAIVTDPSQLPHQDFTYFGDYNYGLQVYKNHHYYNLMRTYNKIETYEDYSKNMNTYDLHDYIITDNSTITEVSKLLGKEIKIGADYVGTKENYLYAEFTTQENGFATIAIPYDKGWTILNNGEEINYYRVNAGVIGIAVNRGENIIEMYYMPVYFKDSLILAFIGIILLVFVMISETNLKKIKI